MVAGLFRSAGYFQGTNLHEPRESNPRGFFEDAEVNNINEALLSPFLPERRFESSVEYLADSPVQGQRWLARIPPTIPIEGTSGSSDQIGTILSQRPFCLKDPRFCYTLHLWRRHAPDARMICVFRRPQVVVASIFKEIAAMPYLANFALSVREAFEVWRLMYSHVLERQALTGEWLFVEYEDLFQLSVLDRLADFSAAQIDRAFPDRSLDRSAAVEAVDPVADKLFAELRARSKATLWD
jgi:hypothetical protein